MCRHNNTRRTRLVRRSSCPIEALEMKQIKCDVGRNVNAMVCVAMDWLDKIRDDDFWLCCGDSIDWHFSLNDDAM